MDRICPGLTATACPWPARRLRRLGAALVLQLASAVVASSASGQVTLYEQEDYGGRSFTTHKRMGNLERTGFNERVASLVVGPQRWEVCEAFRYRGRCAVLGEGRYPSPRAMGLRQGAFSIRIVADNEAIDAGNDTPEPQTLAPPSAPPKAGAVRRWPSFPALSSQDRRADDTP